MLVSRERALTGRGPYATMETMRARTAKRTVTWYWAESQVRRASGEPDQNMTAQAIENMGTRLTGKWTPVNITNDPVPAFAGDNPDAAVLWHSTPNTYVMLFRPQGATRLTALHEIGHVIWMNQGHRNQSNAHDDDFLNIMHDLWWKEAPKVSTMFERFLQDFNVEGITPR